MAQTKKAAAASTGTATVTVALKHPTGIVLEVFEKKTLQVPDGVGRLRDETVFRSTGKQYALNGNRVPVVDGVVVAPNYQIIGGYALTPGIPKDVWDKWLEQHPDSDLVENGLITAYEALDMAQDFAKENAKTRSGMEPLLRSGDPRVPKRRTREGKIVDSVGIADEQPTGVAA